MSSHRGRHASTAGTSTHAPGERWQDQAACLSTDPEMFYPVSESPKATEPALAICHDCPVREICLADELAHGGMQWGVRGGMTAAERRALLRRATQRTPAHACAVCGSGLPGRPRKGMFERRYCSDECRTVARRRSYAEYDRRRKERA